MPSDRTGARRGGQIVRGTTGLSSRIARVAISPADPRVLYMAVFARRGLPCPGTGAGQWAAHRAPRPRCGHIGCRRRPPRRSAQVLPSRPGRPTGLFRTTDGGANWRSVGSFGRVTALSVSASRVIVGVDGKVFTSDDHGGTWTQSSGVRGGAITALANTGATVLAGTRGKRPPIHQPGKGVLRGGIGSARRPDHLDRVVQRLRHGPLGVGLDVGPGCVPVARSRCELHEDQQGADDESAGDAVRPAPVRRRVRVRGSQRSAAAVRRRLRRPLPIRRSSRATGGRSRPSRSTWSASPVSPDYRNDGTVIATTYLKGAYLSSEPGHDVGGQTRRIGDDRRQQLLRTHLPLDHRAVLPRLRRGRDHLLGRAHEPAEVDESRRLLDRRCTVGRLPASATQQLFTIAVSPSYATDRTVYLGSIFGGIFRSTSGGAAGTWTRLGGVGEQGGPIAPPEPAVPGRPGALRGHV